MSKKCLKCGCINPTQAEDPAPGDKCPMCGTLYGEPALAAALTCLVCGQTENAVLGDKCSKCGVRYGELAATATVSCLKCGYIRKSDDSAPSYECPECGAIYARVEQCIASSPAIGRGQPIKKTKTCPHCAEQVNAAATKCPHCKEAIFSEDPVTNSIFSIIVFVVFFFCIYQGISWFSEREAEKTMTKISSEQREMAREIERDMNKTMRDIQSQTRR